MIERIDIYLYTYLEINKDELIGASMYFYEIETTTLKNSYYDSSNYVPHPSPVIADGRGRFPKIFIEKPYRVVISERAGLEVFCDNYLVIGEERVKQ